MRTPWMSRRDRRLWQSASTVPDLGLVMARWLEGDVKSWPGYQSNYGPDEETTDMIPTLAGLNRAGYLTVGSQPGVMGTGYDGKWWSQRAAVEGFVADRDLLVHLLEIADDTGLWATVTGGTERRQHDGITVTRRGGEPHTDFGCHLGSRDLQCMWPVINRTAYAAVEAAWQVTIAAPEYGAGGQRLWEVLDQALDTTPAARAA